MTETPEQNRFQPLESVERLLDILETLTEHGEPMGVSECARATGVNKSTVYRMLATLEQRGYMVKDPLTDRYQMSARVKHLGLQAVPSAGLVERAHERLVALRDATSETVHLTVYQGGGIAKYVDRVESTQPVRSSSLVGTCVPATSTSTGKLLLAHQSDAEIGQVCSALKRYTKLSITSAAGMRAELERIRRSGIAINRGEYRQEVCGVAVGIHDAQGKVVAAVGLCIPQFRFTKSALPGQVKQLRSTAATIEEDLGHAPARAMAQGV
ncbi:IclR family transcriptional regulator [bacterium]|nr:MAG: IclR family transcriptional regulator [bacterium]